MVRDAAAAGLAAGSGLVRHGSRRVADRADCEGFSMDFFERWFHVSPDGGDGTLEALFIAAFAVVAALVVFRRRLVSSVARLTGRTARRGG